MTVLPYILAIIPRLEWSKYQDMIGDMLHNRWEVWKEDFRYKIYYERFPVHYWRSNVDS
jgi:hypothetical protein